MLKQCLNQFRSTLGWVLAAAIAAPVLGAGEPVKLASPGPVGFARAAVWSGDSKSVAVSFDGPPGRVAVWDAASGEHRRTIQHDHPSARGLLFADDNKLLLVAGQAEAAITVFEVQTGKKLRTLKLTDPQIATLDGGIPIVMVSPDSSKVAAVGRSHDLSNTADGFPPGKVWVWDLQSGRMLWSVDGTRARTLAFTGDGKWVAVTGYRPVAVPPTGGNSGGTRYEDCHLTTWEAESGKLHSRLDLGHSTPRRILPKPGTAACLLIDIRGLRWVDVDRAIPGRTVQVPLPPIQQDPALSPDGQSLQFLTAAPRGGHAAAVINLSTGRTVRSLALPIVPILPFRPTISPKGDRVLSAGTDGLRIDPF
jgi:WD40 repeat protein